MANGKIRVGIGGWDYDPWRGTFFPEGLAKAKQLSYAAQRLSAVEVNATYYGSQRPATFAKWAKAVPDGFKFAIKASRFATNRRILAESGESIERFLSQGITELGDRLGPILWQFMPTKKFDADDFAAFLALLPPTRDGLPLRHALEVRHESFRDPAFVSLAKAAGAAIVVADSDEFPMIDERVTDFTYARLQRSVADCPTGYDADALNRWTSTARSWAENNRDAYLFFISGAKERNPSAAIRLIDLLGNSASAEGQPVRGPGTHKPPSS